VQFRADGWSVKRLMKLLVTSAAYRQASRCTPGSYARDPANRLLARGPRFRLDAEAIRDQALFCAGLLVESKGGPSVKPPQPAGLWEAVRPANSTTAEFVADRGVDKVHRRSLYIFWKRTAPPPQLNLLDAPSRESCVLCRDRTNTATQALLLLNETQFIEAARCLAQRVLDRYQDQNDRLHYLFRLALARSPDAKECAELRRLLHRLRQQFHADPASACQLIAIGETVAGPDHEPATLASWTLVASLVLNLDEFLSKE
jgi:hypothetical protein